MARGDAGNILLIGREANTGFDLPTFRKWVFPTTADDANIVPKA
ncbi:hypothetical protein L248_1699 [Schleiferilactobacillus shenzhenensis LY-73]|uniref:Uncharacterized protein n=1 Tax=Schleiferilactobacillus shenzhenensis LY-73 TaxID=1231336 RepID=U4TRB8_9LACO|nr:hypothetical protein L248_1699 [Schleiferilactobacillus shenzhenensis LY-73]